MRDIRISYHILLNLHNWTGTGKFWFQLPVCTLLFADATSSEHRASIELHTFYRTVTYSLLVQGESK